MLVQPSAKSSAFCNAVFAIGFSRQAPGVPDARNLRSAAGCCRCRRCRRCCHAAGARCKAGTSARSAASAPTSSLCCIVFQHLTRAQCVAWGLQRAMSRALASCAARLLQRASAQCAGAGSLAAAAAVTSQPVCSSAARSFAAAAAQGGKRLQPVVSQLQGAAAARAAAAASAGGGTGLAVAAAAARQHTRGFARYLQFQPRQVGRRWDANPDHVLYGLMGVNVAGWVAWQVWPWQVRFLCPAGLLCCCSCVQRGARHGAAAPQSRHGCQTPVDTCPADEQACSCVN